MPPARTRRSQHDVEVMGGRALLLEELGELGAHADVHARPLLVPQVPDIVVAGSPVHAMVEADADLGDGGEAGQPFEGELEVRAELRVGAGDRHDGCVGVGDDRPPRRAQAEGAGRYVASGMSLPAS